MLEQKPLARLRPSLRRPFCFQEDEKLGAVLQLFRALFINLGQGRAYRGIKLGMLLSSAAWTSANFFCRIDLTSATAFRSRQHHRGEGRQYD